jgi:DNA polymerase-3 subunit gamma/tau
MLKLLGEAEQGIRRSANPRLALETLLLRWALMDRAVDLRALLSGAQPSAAPVVKPMLERAAAMSREAAAVGKRETSEPPAPTGGKSPARANSAPGLTAQGPGLSPEALAAAWPDVIATAARQSPLLGQALGHAQPRAAAPGIVELIFGPDSALFHDGVSRQQATVETILGAALGIAVTVRLQSQGSAGAADGAKPKRFTREEVRSERLTQLRSKDPALDAAATALDLELVDDE